MFDRTTVKVGDAEFLVQRTDEEILVNGKKVETPEISLINRFVTVRLPNRVERFSVNRNGDDLCLTIHGRVLPLVIETERDRLLKVASQAAEGEGGAATIRAAMPGLVVKIIAKVGQVVKRGEPVLILEAMKMENEVRSPADGTVQEIRVNERDSVEKGAPLMLVG